MTWRYVQSSCVGLAVSIILLGTNVSNGFDGPIDADIFSTGKMSAQTQPVVAPVEAKTSEGQEKATGTADKPVGDGGSLFSGG